MILQGFSILAEKGGENMSTYTETYNLIKPGEEDCYDVRNFNENMDTIDLQISLAEQSINEVSKKIGEPSESSNTLFSLLERTLTNGNSIIKSIQYVSFSNTSGSTTTTANIQSINPEKCFVLLERLKGYNSELSYKLEETQLIATHGSYASQPYTWGFWIIEFN